MQDGVGMGKVKQAKEWVNAWIIPLLQWMH